ncbi:MAG: 50S ribosomal protein L29 [Actinomycetota bacterium]
MPSKAAELRELPEDELYARMESAKEELFNLRFQLATGQLDNTGRLKELRHDVARIATVLREREIEEELDAIVATGSVGATAAVQVNDDETHEDGETQ